MEYLSAEYNVGGSDLDRVLSPRLGAYVDYQNNLDLFLANLAVWGSLPVRSDLTQGEADESELRVERFLYTRQTYHDLLAAAQGGEDVDG